MLSLGALPTCAAVSWVLALAALALTLGPWLGRLLPVVDALSSALPLALLLAVCTLAFARKAVVRLIALAAILLALPILASEVWPRPETSAPGGNA